MNRPRRVAAACLAALALSALSACSSTPGNRRVVSDVIESLQLPEEQEQCMLDRLDGYTDDQLDSIADENENWDPSSGSTMEEASESMRLFIRDFEECTTESAAPSQTSEPTGTSEPAATSEPSGTSEPSAESGEAVETTLG